MKDLDANIVTLRYELNRREKHTIVISVYNDPTKTKTHPTYFLDLIGSKVAWNIGWVGYLGLLRFLGFDEKGGIKFLHGDKNRFWKKSLTSSTYGNFTMRWIRGMSLINSSKNIFCIEPNFQHGTCNFTKIGLFFLRCVQDFARFQRRFFTADGGLQNDKGGNKWTTTAQVAAGTRIA